MKKVKIIFSIFIICYIIGAISVRIYYHNLKTLNSGWYSRKNAFSQEVINPNSIVFLGNSITEGFYVYKRFPNYLKYNRGISGDMTTGILERLDQIICYKPKIIVIMIGINDLSRNRDVNDIIENYRKILQEISSETPTTKIIVESILPIRKPYDFWTYFVNYSTFLSGVRPLNMNSYIKDTNAKNRESLQRTECNLHRSLAVF